MPAPLTLHVIVPSGGAGAAGRCAKTYRTRACRSKDWDICRCYSCHIMSVSESHRQNVRWYSATIWVIVLSL
jgi:hypothetical protein